MASGKPIVRQAAWLSLIPQICFMGLLLLIYSHMIEPFYRALMLTGCTYLLISFSLRFRTCRYHRNGVAHCKSDRYDKAITEFEKSYEFFTKYAWVDKYRYITLLSSTKISYTEMALVNIAFCNMQMGNSEISRQYYEKTLALFPDSEIAKIVIKRYKTLEGFRDYPNDFYVDKYKTDEDNWKEELLLSKQLLLMCNNIFTSSKKGRVK